MRVYRLFLLLVLLPLLTLTTHGAATVWGIVRDRSGQLVGTNVTYIALQRPLASSGYVSVGYNFSTNSDSTTGGFTNTLVAGDYAVRFGTEARDAFIISVPDDSDTYAITTIATNSTALTYRLGTLGDTYWLLKTNGTAAWLGGTTTNMALYGTTWLYTHPVAGSFIIGNTNQTGGVQFYYDETSEGVIASNIWTSETWLFNRTATNGVMRNGDIELVAGSGVTITASTNAGKVTYTITAP